MGSRGARLPAVQRPGALSRRGKTAFPSSIARNAGAIGLMTNAPFDSLKSGEGWRDQGLVLMSKDGDDFNVIDPFRIDAVDGRAYPAFGSFWSGIKLSELNPETGELLRADTPRIALASREGGGAGEAASILDHDGKSIFFVSFDQCCKASPRLRYSRRPRGPDRGAIRGQRRQSGAGGRRLRAYGDDRRL
jgi:arabinan endo-1,5-alpha-L-arabinosidase